MERIEEIEVDRLNHSVCIIADEQVISEDSLEWRNESMYESLLTLREIQEQLAQMNYQEVFYVVADLGLRGNIYRYGNDKPRSWEHYATTKGFA